MESLALVLFLNVGCNDKKWNDKDKKIIREEIITLSEKILAGCTDDNLRYWSIQRLCSTYASMGESEKAASFAKKMPNTSQGNMITETLKGTKKYKHIQQQIAQSAFYGVINSIVLLMTHSSVSLDDGSEPYNSDECIELNHKIIDIINILIEKGSFGDFNFWLVSAHQSLTFLYVKKNDTAAALNHFRLAAKHAVIYDSMPPVNDNLKGEYESLLFKGIKFPFNMVHCPYTMAEQLLEKSRELDSVLPTLELEEIKNELRKHTAIN